MDSHQKLHQNEFGLRIPNQSRIRTNFARKDSQQQLHQNGFLQRIPVTYPLSGGGGGGLGTGRGGGVEDESLRVVV